MTNRVPIPEYRFPANPLPTKTFDGSTPDHRPANPPSNARGQIIQAQAQFPIEEERPTPEQLFPPSLSPSQTPLPPAVFPPLPANPSVNQSPRPLLDTSIPPVAPTSPTGEKFELSVPIANPADANVNVMMEGGKLSLTARGAPLTTVLELIAQQSGLNLVAAEDVTGNVSVTLRNITLDTALYAILQVNGYSWSRQADIIIVTKLSSESTSLASSQGRVVRVFDLNFLAASGVQEVVTGLLSPVGKSFIVESSPTDRRRTQEQLIVEDLPEYLERIEQYLFQSDVAPRQVLIEAHILQINLKDENRHGVDFASILARIDTAKISMKTQGFTNTSNSPSFFLGVDGTDLDLVIEALQTTTDSKTLASPKLLVLNGQESQIQIGAQLGFLVTTTTQTSTLQQVDFLEVGVVLAVTPQITADNQILMKVKPKVSTGNINPVTGLPEEETTEVETTVMLSNGKGMIIGGLIQELDIENQSKIPIVGDLRKVGRFFQKRGTNRERNEIIIVLVPRLVPTGTPYDAQLEEEMLRATSPLVGPHLESIDRRPLEPELPDAYLNPRRFSWPGIKTLGRRPKSPLPTPIRQKIAPFEGDQTIQGFHPYDPDILGGNSLSPAGTPTRNYHAPVMIPPTPQL